MIGIKTKAKDLCHFVAGAAVFLFFGVTLVLAQDNTSLETDFLSGEVGSEVRISTFPTPIGDSINDVNNPYTIYAVGVKYGDWRDSSRNRRVPVKIYYPISKTSPSPVILFSHGLGGSYERCDYLGKKWASNGFISVHVHHYGCDESVWKNKLRPFKELRDVYQVYWTGRTQTNDLKFVLNQLEVLATTDPNFGARLDLSRVGAAGYDLGGLASLLLAGQLPPDHRDYLFDDRIKVIVVMSPPVNDTFFQATSVYQTIQTPALFFTGTEDNGVIGNTRAFQRRIPFDNLLNADRFLVTYNGSDHLVYGGHFFSINGGNDKMYQNNIATISLKFWQAYLENDPRAYDQFRQNQITALVGRMGQIESKFAPILVPISDYHQSDDPQELGIMSEARMQN